MIRVIILLEVHHVDDHILSDLDGVQEFNGFIDNLIVIITSFLDVIILVLFDFLLFWLKFGNFEIITHLLAFFPGDLSLAVDEGKDVSSGVDEVHDLLIVRVIVKNLRWSFWLGPELHSAIVYMVNWEVIQQSRNLVMMHLLEAMSGHFDT
jgi:hypothetical protein